MGALVPAEVWGRLLRCPRSSISSVLRSLFSGKQSRLGRTFPLVARRWRSSDTIGMEWGVGQTGGQNILLGAPSLGQSDLVVRRGSAHKAASSFLYFLLRHETALVSGAKEDSFRAGGGVVLGVDWCHVQPSLS